MLISLSVTVVVVSFLKGVINYLVSLFVLSRNI